MISCVLLGYALLSRRLEGTVVSAAMFFVVAGDLAGWTGIVDLGAAAHGGPGEEASREAVLVVAELALVLLLFGDAAGIDLRTLRRNALSVRLLAIGLPLTIGLGTVLAVVVLADLELWECAIVAAVLAPTDAALGQAVVTSHAVPARIRQALNVESGLNDGGSVPFLMLFIALAAAEEGLGGGWLAFTVEQIGLGALVGGRGRRRRGPRPRDAPSSASGRCRSSHSSRSPRSRSSPSSPRTRSAATASSPRSSAAAQPARPRGARPSGRSSSPRSRASSSP